MGGVIIGRQLPSEGLSPYQMLSTFESMNMSPAYIKLPKNTREDKKAGVNCLYALLCRYVNSQVPPIVMTNKHSWTVVGYRYKQQNRRGAVILYRHDDGLGPYLAVENPWRDPGIDGEHRTWLTMVAPLPKKIYMSAERAELVGRTWLQLLANRSPTPHRRGVKSQLQARYRTYALRSSDYKRQLEKRGLPGEVADLYRLSHWPRYLWIVEAFDADLQDNGADAILGEVIIDPTAHHLSEPGDTDAILCMHWHGKALSFGLDHDKTREVSVDNFRPYSSGRTGASW
jgi:hypothetical protein